MEKVIIRLERAATDAIWALPGIAKQITEGYISGDYHGAKWWIEDEEGEDD